MDHIYAHSTEAVLKDHINTFFQHFDITSLV